MRIILAGIAGGIAMFSWSFCSHTVLPGGESKSAASGETAAATEEDSSRENQA